MTRGSRTHSPLVTELEDVNDVDDFAIRLAELLSPILLDDAGELSAASKGLVGAVPGPLGDLPPRKTSGLWHR